MFIKNVNGVDTIYIFPEEYDDIDYLILSRLHAFHIHSSVWCDAATAVYSLALKGDDKENMKHLLHKCLKVAGSTPDSEMLAWSPVHNRFRLMRPFRFYAGAIEDIIAFLEKEKTNER